MDAKSNNFSIRTHGFNLGLQFYQINLINKLKKYQTLTKNSLATLPGEGPITRSQGEDNFCSMPIPPPNLSFPCLPLPAIVVTSSFCRSI